MSGLLNRLKKITESLLAQNSPLDQEAEAAAKDLRLHARYNLQDDEATLLIKGIPSDWRINNISYSGLSGAITDPSHAPANLDPQFIGQLTFLDRHQLCHLSKVRTLEKDGKVTFFGAEFRHLDPETLIFLRTFLEPRRWGQSLVLVPPEFRTDRYRGDSWHCFRGEGPTDLIYHNQPTTFQKPLFSSDQNPEGALTTVLLTFLINGRYGELRWKDGILTTSIASKDESKGFQVGATMETLPTFDAQLLRHGLCTLSGLNQDTKKSLKPFISEVRRLLDLTHETDNRPTTF